MIFFHYTSLLDCAVFPRARVCTPTEEETCFTAATPENFDLSELYSASEGVAPREMFQDN